MAPVQFRSHGFARGRVGCSRFSTIPHLRCSHIHSTASPHRRFRQISAGARAQRRSQNMPLVGCNHIPASEWIGDDELTDCRTRYSPCDCCERVPSNGRAIDRRPHGLLLFAVGGRMRAIINRLPEGEEKMPAAARTARKPPRRVSLYRVFCYTDYRVIRNTHNLCR